MESMLKETGKSHRSPVVSEMVKEAFCHLNDRQQVRTDWPLN
jgi:hypothetical protein